MAIKRMLENIIYLTFRMFRHTSSGVTVSLRSTSNFNFALRGLEAVILRLSMESAQTTYVMCKQYPS